MKTKNLVGLHVVKLNFRGGLITPSELLETTQAAEVLGIETLGLGERQSVFLASIEKTASTCDVTKLFSRFDFETDKDEFPNIVTSYGTERLFSIGTPWLGEGHYRDALDSFDHRPKLRINITDKAQSLVPLFSGHLNFVASEADNYWHLILRLPQTPERLNWPDLIYTTDLGRVSLAIERSFLEGIPSESLVDKVSASGHFKVRKSDAPPSIPRIRFPYYEGMNRSDGVTWLGIFRRNNDYPVNFLHDLAKLCERTRVGLIFLTPRRSMIIRGIQEEHRFLWERVLGLHGINTRHSANELNWHYRDFDTESLRLKNDLTTEFHRKDTRTYGLSFAIQNEGSEFDASILIERCQQNSRRYNVRLKQNFDTNSAVSAVFARKVKRLALVETLGMLCKRYFHDLNEIRNPEPFPAQEPHLFREWIKVQQCPRCFTIYDERFGDSLGGIPARTTFAAIRDAYRCSVCSAPGDLFHEVLKEG